MRFAKPFFLTLCLCGFAYAGDLEDRIRDLGSDDFKRRETATAWLSDQGPEAVPQLEAAAKDKDPEVRWRAEKALLSIRARGGRAAAPAKPREPRPVDPPQTAEPPPRTDVQPVTPDPDDLGDAIDRARRRLKQVEEQLKKARPGLEDFLGGLRSGDFDPDRILQEMERRFRELEQPDRNLGASHDFWSFRFKDGKWELVRPEDPVLTRVGVRTQPTPPVLKAQLKLEGEPDGIVVEEVAPGGLAAAAKLQPWDLILRVDGKPVSAEGDLEALLAPGDHAIQVVRAGARIDLAVTTPRQEAARPPATTPAPATPRAPEPSKKDELKKY
jgi:hypothetical protein